MSQGKKLCKEVICSVQKICNKVTETLSDERAIDILADNISNNEQLCEASSSVWNYVVSQARKTIPIAIGLTLAIQGVRVVIEQCRDNNEFEEEEEEEYSDTESDDSGVEEDN